MKKILVVVDMQNDFIDGALGSIEAQSIVGNVCRTIEAYDPSDIFVTMDTHGADYLQTEEGRNLPVVHCVRGTKGWELRPEVKEAVRDARVFEKRGFGSAQLMQTLREMYGDGEDLVVTFIGLCTDVCVATGALMCKAHLPQAHVVADASCCAGLSQEKHLSALETMRSCHIEVIND